jgi:hypothetical protein
LETSLIFILIATNIFGDLRIIKNRIQKYYIIKISKE